MGRSKKETIALFKNCFNSGTVPKLKKNNSKNLYNYENRKTRSCLLQNDITWNVTYVCSLNTNLPRQVKIIQRFFVKYIMRNVDIQKRKREVFKESSELTCNNKSSDRHTWKLDVHRKKSLNQHAIVFLFHITHLPTSHSTSSRFTVRNVHRKRMLFQYQNICFLHKTFYEGKEPLVFTLNTDRSSCFLRP